ncbi:hypothetical protein D9615_004354 [Tricholomella constricta]|uniref:Uncharacterized protein n=1 Tax=Tricholomella constricta TaxID=117010 RepID=A0A8H5M5Z4_9AGAR|nr:hypothetical protein D9615_004354 [Tricholomella constricta]
MKRAECCPPLLAPNHLGLKVSYSYLMTRGGTPLGLSAPSLEASNQAQIDDLVQRNRTLEHTKQKLSEQLAHETARSKESLIELQKQWQTEQTEWRQGCDVLQSCHRVVQLRNLVELEKERINVLKELDATRKEKLLRLQRDYRITMFQAREAELEDRIWELEDESDAMIAEFEESARRLKGNNVEYVAQIQVKDNQLAIAEAEKEELQGKYKQLEEQHFRLQATGDELVTTLERTTLQYESATTTVDEIKRTNEELRRSNADMLRQIDRWQTLETKGGAEVDAQRKKRIQLEVQVQDLQSQLEKAKEEHEMSLEKEKRRVEKLKMGIKEWQAECEKHEHESEEAQMQLAKSEKQITKLKEALEVARVRPSSPEQKRAAFAPQTVDDDEEAAAQPSPPPEPLTSRPKPRARQAQNKPSSKGRALEPVNAEAGPSSTGNEKTTKPPSKRKLKAAAESDVEEVLLVDKPEKSKSKTRASPISEERNSDIEEVPQKVKPKGKGKAKALEEPEEVEIIAPEEPPKKRGTKRKVFIDAEEDNDIEVLPSSQKTRKPRSKRAGSGLRETGAEAQRKVSGRVGSASVQMSHDAESDAEKEPAVKKKRRKINIFPTNVEPTAFNFMPGVDGGLNIPTVLSPVKDSEAVPSRSTSGSVIGSIGSMLRNSFARR